MLATILAIVAILIALSANSRAKRIEKIFSERSPQVPSGPSSTPEQRPAVAPAAPASIAAVSSAAAALQPAVPLGPTAGEKFAAWLKEDWLLKLGALLLLIGFGWFVSYAFAHNWIGPLGRITLGILAGVAILLVGWRRVRKFLHQGSIFLALGSTVILLTIFAAREIYEFFTPFTALTVMFLSTAFVALLSVKYRSRALALISLILAAIAPLLTNTPAPNYVALFFYLLVIVLGAIWIVALTGWVEVPLAALIVVAAYSIPKLAFGSITDAAPLLPFAYAFAAIFLVSNIIRILKTARTANRELFPDLVIAVGNGVLLLAWILKAAPEVWQSLLLSAWMLVFVGASFMVFRLTGRREPFLAYAAVGVAMLGAATAAELAGAALTIAYTIEVALLVLLILGIVRDRRLSEVISLLFIISVIRSAESTWSRWSTVFNEHFFVLLFLAIAILGLGIYFVRSYQRQNQKLSGISKLLVVVGSLYAYVLIWNSLHVIFAGRRDVAVAVSLIVYTLIGLISYFSGGADGKGLRYYGGALLAFVVLRLLIVDVWQMELAGKIITFFLVGGLLMTTAFIGRRFKIRKSPIQ